MGGTDLVIALSHSGTTAEVMAAATLLHERGLPVYAITGAKPGSEQVREQGRVGGGNTRGVWGPAGRQGG